MRGSSQKGDSVLRHDRDLIHAYRFESFDAVISGHAVEELAKHLNRMSRQQLEELLVSVFLGNSAQDRSAARLRWRLADRRRHSKEVSTSRSQSAAQAKRVIASRNAMDTITKKWRSHIEKNGWQSMADIPHGERTKFANWLITNYGSGNRKKADWPYFDPPALARKLGQLAEEVFPSN